MKNARTADSLHNLLLIDDDVELCSLMADFFAQHHLSLEAVHD